MRNFDRYASGPPASRNRGGPLRGGYSTGHAPFWVSRCCQKRVKGLSRQEMKGRVVPTETAAPSSEPMHELAGVPV